MLKISAWRTILVQHSTSIPGMVGSTALALQCLISLALAHSAKAGFADPVLAGIDVVPPLLKISSPASGQRFTNATATAFGTASDAGGLFAVFYQMNNEAWQRAVGATNWTAPVTLLPGANVFRAYAQDETGNRSTTNSLPLSYVLNAPLAIQIGGSGSVTPNYQAQWLEVGKTYSITAKAGKGFVFKEWIGAVNGVVVFRTNAPKLTFAMRVDLALNANFSDVTKPVLTITAPKPAQRFSNAVATVVGKASDNGPMAGVYFQINGSPWLAATGTTNWTATINLTAGANSFRAYVRDTAGNSSATNTLPLSYVVSAPLTIQVSGDGKIAPNYHGQWLEVGKSYSMTATAGKGSKFSEWIGSLNGVVAWCTNVAKLNFTMRSNLVLNVIFADGQKPLVVINSPTAGARLTDTSLVVRGTASDNQQVAQVRCQLNSGPWFQASGTTSWTANLTAQGGGNTFRVTAVDAAGNYSITNSVSFICLKDLLVNYWPMHSGDWRNFNGPIGAAAMSFSGGPLEFSMDLTLPDDNLTSFYAYSSDFRELHLTGGKYGWTRYSFVPPIVELTEGLLLDGGSKKSESSISVRGQTVQASVTVKLSDAGTITVPKGTYSECKRVDVTVTATIPGEGTGTFSAESYTLAPKIGMIRVGAYQSSGSGFKFLGWEELTSASVAGASVAVPSVRSLNAAPADSPGAIVRSESLFQVAETPLVASDFKVRWATLEWAESTKGELLLVLRGAPNTEYFLEAGSEHANTVLWEPFWVGTAPDGEVRIPVDRTASQTLYRLRPVD